METRISFSRDMSRIAEICPTSRCRRIFKKIPESGYRSR